MWHTSLDNIMLCDACQYANSSLGETRCNIEIDRRYSATRNEEWRRTLKSEIENKHFIWTFPETNK